jgi:hypothetical protein
VLGESPGTTPATFALPFLPTRVMNRHAPIKACRKRIHHHAERRSHHHRSRRHRCGTGRDSCAGEGLLEEGRHQEDGRAQAKAGKKATKPASAKEASTPRAESKGAKILALIGRAKAASLAEIMQATDWMAHSVRGFLSTAAKKHGLKIESTKTEAGDRVYRIKK